MNACNEYIDAAVTYSTGVLSMCASYISGPDFGSHIMSIGGFVLLAARLIVDVPKAWHSIKRRWHG